LLEGAGREARGRVGVGQRQHRATEASLLLWVVFLARFGECESAVGVVKSVEGRMDVMRLT
jgi:hypothetical protein